MRRVLRFVLWGLIGVVALGGVLGALFGYFVYSPAHSGNIALPVPQARHCGTWYAPNSRSSSLRCPSGESCFAASYVSIRDVRRLPPSLRSVLTQLLKRT